MTELERMEKRKRVESGIKRDVHHPNVRTVDYQPGNRTRYLVTVVSLQGEQCEMYGTSEHGRLVTVLGIRGLVTYPISADGFSDLSAVPYVAEKFSLNQIDAEAVTELLGYLFGSLT
jgi:hypothetical protein